MKVDIDKIPQLMNDVDNNSDYIDNIVNSLVESCCSSLDNYVSYVKDLLNNDNYTLTNRELDDIIMTIPSLCYFAGEQQERLGIRCDVSKSTRNVMYNKIFSDTIGTAGVKKASADMQLFNEDIVSVIYDRAYSIIKSKISFATEILQSAKKVISRRMAESDISKIMSNKERS